MNIVPVIGKADTLTVAEVSNFGLFYSYRGRGTRLLVCFTITVAEVPTFGLFSLSPIWVQYCDVQALR